MSLVNKMKQLALVSLLMLGTAFAPQVQATTYSDIVVFGDSLSDSGNVFDLFGGLFGPAPPYTDSRFTSNYSNGDPGLVWVEHLAGLLGLSLDNSLAPAGGGTNYAFGGAELTNDPSQLVPSLPDQLDFYFGDTGGSADSDALYVVFGGGNDVRDNDISASVANVANIISSLAANGAMNFFVPNLPDIGLTPESQAGAAPGGDAATISLAASTFNSQLAVELAALEASLGVNIITFDLFGLFNDILSDPGAFGISNVTEACIGLDGNSACVDPDSYLFFDGIHPTAFVHQMMGELAFNALKPVPLPAALPLMLSALGLLGWRRKKA